MHGREELVSTAGFSAAIRTEFSITSKIAPTSITDEQAKSINKKKLLLICTSSAGNREKCHDYDRQHAVSTFNETYSQSASKFLSTFKSVSQHQFTLFLLKNEQSKLLLVKPELL
ncbi:Germination protease [Dirofilaria immitis]